MKNKSTKQLNKQEAAIRYICQNLLDFGRLRHDLISDQVQIQTQEGNWRDFTDKDANTIVCQCSQELGIAITAKEVRAVVHSDMVPAVHPLRDYVHECARAFPDYTTAKDGRDWIDFLADQVTVKGGPEEQRLWKDCFKKWFVAMVAAWLDDSIVNHQVLILIGEQGIYKTTWLERLLPPELRNYGCQMGNNTYLSKDDKLRIAEYGLINIDEIDAMSNKTLNAYKSLITAQAISERAAYRYNKEKRIHLASFCASGNKPEFLTDITGTRRWMPFNVEHIQNPWTTQLPYQQIYANALYLIQHGFCFFFEQQENQRLDMHNDAFRAQTQEEQLIPVFLAVPEPNDPDAQFLTASEISDLLATKGGIKKPLSPSQLGTLLRKAGYLPKRRKGIRGFVVKQLTDNEIKNNRASMANA